MGNKPEKDSSAVVKINVSFKQVLKLLGQLTDEQKLDVWDALKIDLEEKGLLTWVKNGKGSMMELSKLTKNQEQKYKQPLITIDMMRDWEKDLPEEDEKEMTDEEVLKAIEEMS